MAKTSPDVAQKQTGEADEILRDPSRVHEIAGQHEERNGQKRKSGQAAENRLDQCRDGHAVAEQCVDQGATAQCNHDRRRNAQKRNKGQKEDDHCTLPFCPMPRKVSSSSIVRKNMMKKPVGSAA